MSENNKATFDCDLPSIDGPISHREALALYAQENVALRAEIAALRKVIDDACAVTLLPDTTNDGGPADLAEEIRRLLNELRIEGAEIAALREAVRRLWPGDLTPPFSDQRIALQLRMIRVPESSVPIIRLALEEKP